MRIRSKLLANTIVTVLCLIIVGGIGFFFTHNVANMSMLLVEKEAIPIIKISALETSVSEMWLRLTVHSGVSEVEIMQQLEQEIVQLKEKIVTQFQELDQSYTIEAETNIRDEMSNVEFDRDIDTHIRTLKTFQKNWQQFDKIASQILLLSQDFTKEDALSLIVKEGRVAYNKVILNLRELIEQHRKNMEVMRDAAINTQQQAAWAIIILTVLISIFVLLFVNRFSRRLLRPLLQINSQLKSLALGQLVEDDIKYQGKDEIAEIVLSSRQLKESINNTIKQTNAIATGHYDSKIELRSEQDKLGQALSDMIYTLREVTEKNATQDWLKTGQNQLNEQMSGEQNIVDLAHNIVSFLTIYVEAQVGVCYSIEHATDNSNQNLPLKLLASYAYSRRKNLGEEFGFSEGLVERAVKEQKNILITIDSGLSEAIPPHLFLTPFLYENVVKGVILLGSSEVLTELHQDFIEQVMPSIGIAVNSIEARSKMQVLLQQTQVQAEELTHQKDKLQSQTEELQHQKEELQSQSEEMQSQTEELQTQAEELRQSNEELEERTQDLEEQKEEVRGKNKALQETQQAISIKAEELEMASKYKSEFLANMSHELRTPLNSLLILSQLLSENKEGNLSDKQIEYAETVHSAGSDLLTLINDILDLSKVEAGKMEVNPDDLSLTEFFDMINQKFRHVAEKKGLAFHINVANNVPETLYTDVQRLQQIINNLLSNAFKFTSEGEVRLTVQRPSDEFSLPHLSQKEAGGNLSFKALDPAKTIAISVTDTGIGIPKDKQQVIFQAFQQVDGTTSRRYGGTGLGLSISRQLARLLGGEIQLHCKGKEGKGCTFTLYLPEKMSVKAFQSSGIESSISESIPQFTEIESSVLDKALTNQSTGTESLNSSSFITDDDRNNFNPEDKTLLIIEDDGKFSHIIMDIGREKGFKCLIAQDGKTGLQLVQDYHPNAIILDVGLPEIDGWTVMDRLKDNPDTRHIPVHFISGSDQSVEAKKMGAIGYLLKPVNMEQLGEAFKNIEQFLSKTVKTLLVIADNKPHQQKILELVESDDVQTTLVVTKVDALTHLKVTVFDCIILDMDIEQGTGINLLEQMRTQKDEGLCQMPIIIYADRDLTSSEEALLQQYAENFTIKSVRSPERLLDEATLFLHQLEANLPEEKRNMLKMVHDKEAILMNKTVLIVDDDIRNVFALATMLEDRDMEIISAVNGKEGLALLDKHQEEIAIVLMDIMMPEMDGYEAMQQIRAQPRYKKLPIIALTAKAMKGDKAKCIEAGASDYLPKPVDTDKLLSLMRVWLYR